METPHRHRRRRPLRPGMKRPSTMNAFAIRIVRQFFLRFAECVEIYIVECATEFTRMHQLIIHRHDQNIPHGRSVLKNNKRILLNKKNLVRPAHRQQFCNDCPARICPDFNKPTTCSLFARTISSRRISAAVGGAYCCLWEQPASTKINTATAKRIAGI